MNNSIHKTIAIRSLFLVLCPLLVMAGCRSQNRSDRTALAGGLLGAGAGAIIGHKLGDTTAGTAIGAGLGAMTGAVVGEQMDEMEIRNREQIAAQLGRQVQQGQATSAEVVEMSRAGVDPILITNYIKSSGVIAPLTAGDVIALHKQGVDMTVIQTLQNASQQPAPSTPRIARPPVIIEEHYYGQPHCAPPRIHYRHHHGHRPRVGWGVSFSG